MHDLLGYAIGNLEKIKLKPEEKTLRFSGKWRNSYEAALWKSQFGFSEEPHLLDDLRFSKRVCEYRSGKRDPGKRGILPGPGPGINFAFLRAEMFPPGETTSSILRKSLISESWMRNLETSKGLWSVRIRNLNCKNGRFIV